jgi:hypothetical protein
MSPLRASYNGAVPPPAVPGRCFYCGEPHRSGDDPREHIVADALGGTLTTRRVAQICNQRAGGEIDYRLQSDWFITQEMHLLGLDGRKPVVEASVQGAPGATVGLGPDFKPKPRSALNVGDTEATIIASNEQEVARLTERLEKRLAAEGRSVAGPSTRREVPVEWVNVPVSIDGVMWLRAAAKMTLGVMSLSQPDDWLDTPSARQLIGWLWDETPVDENGQLASLFPRSPDEREAELFPAPAHTVLQMTMRNGRVGVSFDLFGKHIVSLPVEVLEPVSDTCWIMAADKPCRAVSVGKLAQEWAEKQIRDAHTSAEDPPASNEWR